MLGAVTASLNLHSHLCYYCLSGRQATRFAAFLPPPAPTSGCLSQEHAFLRAFPGRGPDPLLSHAGACVRTPFLCACGGYLGAGETAGSPGL